MSSCRTFADLWLRMAFDGKQVSKWKKKSTAGAGACPEPWETVDSLQKRAEDGSPKPWPRVGRPGGSGPTGSVHASPNRAAEGSIIDEIQVKRSFPTDTIRQQFALIAQESRALNMRNDPASPQPPSVASMTGILRRTLNRLRIADPSRHTSNDGTRP